jgi:hypothetical protein
LLLKTDARFREPSKAERSALLEGFAKRGRVLYGAAYDIVKLLQPVDLGDPQAIADSIASIVVFEIKSTNRLALKPDWKGYFFNLTTAELLVSQSLGDQFRFAFVNIVSGEVQEWGLADIYKRARAIYPAWHIRF